MPRLFCRRRRSLGLPPGLVLALQRREAQLVAVEPQRQRPPVGVLVPRGGREDGARDGGLHARAALARVQRHVRLFVYLRVVRLAREVALLTSCGPRARTSSVSPPC